MVLLKKGIGLTLLCLILSACQLGYIAESAYYQADMLRKRVPIKYALRHYDLTEHEKHQLEIALKVRDFMKTELGLDTRSNYKRYVHLDRDYVTYVVSAAHKDELKQYTWSFPIIGSVPYKGYFKKEKAEELQRELASEDLDTHLRGVSAFSTLGWFEDPIISTMLKYSEEDFVSTLIHETVHANLYIEGKSKFNERVATFLGQLGAEAYYKKQNKDQEFREKLADKSHDSLLFSKFITEENDKLKQWYIDNQNNPQLLQLREKQFAEIKNRFTAQVQPKLKTDNYDWFKTRDLNNALLLLLGLYNSDFSQLEKLADKEQRDFQKTFKHLKTLEDVDDPEKELEKLI